jgi:hypothetical protein
VTDPAKPTEFRIPTKVTRWNDPSPFPPIATRTDRLAAMRAEMHDLGAQMLEDALQLAERTVAALREVAEAPRDAIPDGQRDAAGKLAADLDSRVTTMRQIQGRQS